MGLLTEGEPGPRSYGGPGQKFVDLYRSLDPDDQEKIRRWSAQQGGIMFVYRKLNEHEQLAIGYSSIHRGLERLEAAGWEC